MKNDYEMDDMTLIEALMISIVNDLTPEERFGIANLDEDEIRTLELIRGRYIKFRIEQLNEQGNRELLNECRERSGDESLDDAGAASFILKEIWSHVRETNKIRVVK